MKSIHPTHRKAPLHRARRVLSAWSAAALLAVTVLTAAAASTGSASADELEFQLGPTMSGRAYSIGFFDTKILGAPVPDGGSPDTGWVSSQGTQTFTRPCTNVSLGFASATANCVKVATDAESRSVTSSTSLATAQVGITGLPAVDAKAVNATSQSSCYGEGSTGSVTIAYLKVGSKVVIAQPTPIAPNTRLTVGVVSLTLNEQSYGPNGFTVNAIHLNANVPGVAQTNAVISSATSKVSGCYYD